MRPSADLVLANRSYLDHDAPLQAGEDVPPPGGGGLLAALRPVIASMDGDGRGTTWVGAGRGPYDREFTDARGFEVIQTSHGPLRHRRLYFSQADWERHYAAVANSFSWPLFHLVRPDLLTRAPYFPVPATPPAHAWAAHRRVGQAFARAAIESEGSTTCWVHDYQLALVPAMAREGGYRGSLGFFLHTPFPLVSVARAVLPPEGLDRLRELVRGILGASLAGFQSRADEARFLEAAIELCGARLAPGGLEAGGRRVRTGAYPVGIDADGLLAHARAALPAGLRPPPDAPRPLVAGLERADYTKGIPERLAAVARSYTRGVAFSYVGIAAPTRPGVPSYDALGDTIAAGAGDAGTAAHASGSFFRHSHESIPWDGVLALQREAGVVFTSSVADGMNLVPLQAAVVQSLRPPGSRAVVIAGKDTGAAHAFPGFEEDGLVTVDPLDPEAMDAVLAAAVQGRLPGVADRLVDAVRRHDALSWATSFLGDLEEAAC